MRANTFSNFFLFFVVFLIILTPFETINIHFFSKSVLENYELNAIKTPMSFLNNYAFACSPNNTLHLVFNEQSVISRLKYLEANNNYQWNLTASIIMGENNTLKLFGNPSLLASSNKLWLVNLFRNGEFAGVILFSKGYFEQHWHNEIILSNTSFMFKQLTIQEVKGKNALWLSWLDNHEGVYTIYSMIYNITTNIWNPIMKVSDNSGENCTDSTFTISQLGAGHFVWAEGLANSERIMYRKIYLNGTMEPIEIVTESSTSCKLPSIVIDSNETINIFWSNYTEIYPERYGTKNIQYSYKAKEGSWSTPLKVAPYIPVDRPIGGGSDAEKQSVTIDNQNKLWLVYEIRETYLAHMGIDIRYHNLFGWQASERVSMFINLAINPLIKADNAGSIHCLWMDFRSGYYEIYYKVRFVTNFWSNEIVLTRYSLGSGDFAKFFLIISGVTILLTLPVIILNRFRARREKKHLDKKIRSLQE